MRVTTAFNRMLDIPGATVRSVTFAPEGIVVGIGRRTRRLRCPCGYSTRSCHETSTRRRTRRAKRSGGRIVEWRQISEVTEIIQERVVDGHGPSEPGAAVDDAVRRHLYRRALLEQRHQPSAPLVRVGAVDMTARLGAVVLIEDCQFEARRPGVDDEQGPAHPEDLAGALVRPSCTTLVGPRFASW